MSTPPDTSIKDTLFYKQFLQALSAAGLSIGGNSNDPKPYLRIIGDDGFVYRVTIASGGLIDATPETES